MSNLFATVSSAGGWLLGFMVVTINLLIKWGIDAISNRSAPHVTDETCVETRDVSHQDFIAVGCDCAIRAAILLTGFSSTPFLPNRSDVANAMEPFDRKNPQTLPCVPRSDWIDSKT